MDEKKSEIVKAAIQMFRRYGIRSVSMDDLAVEMHISKKTIYRYFHNKEEIVDAMLQSHEEHENQIIDQCNNAEGSKNAIDVLMLVSQKICDNMLKINPAFIFDMQKYYPQQLQAFWKTKREYILKKIEWNLNRGINENLYRSNINVELVAGLYVRRFEDFQREADEISKKFSFEEIFSTMFELSIRGICNEAGKQYFETKKQELITKT